ncbi:MAG: hypothetical protein MUC69_09780, partial [Gemmatimonadales bacterium]|nr:hypothetical protein [Gemmatimonadales bacterium]
IAEPWDLGPDGYQLGRFPRGWSEWNGRYRDAVRRFWRGAGGIGEFAARLSGSSDLFEHDGRTPHAGVNFVACHDGYSLADLVMYERKHNLPNGERNRDGHDWNESRNWGVEGPADDPRTVRRRARVRRSLLATVALSLGVPMLRHGDELLQSLGGNNNAYCHDSPLTWLDWGDAPERGAWLAFVRRVLALRREAEVVRRDRFLPWRDGPLAPLQWFTLAGVPLTPAQWDDPARHTLAALLRLGADGAADEARPVAGERWWLLAMNGGGRSQEVLPPAVPGAGVWRLRLDTADPERSDDAVAPVRLAPHALALLETVVVG